MTDPIGLSAVGFTPRKFTDIIADVKTEMMGIFPTGMSVDDSSPDVQSQGIGAEQYVKLWDALLGIYSQLDPNTALGTQQDLINGGVRGVPRILPSPTEVTCNITGTPSMTLPKGSLASSSDAALSYLSFSSKQDATYDGSGNASVVMVANTNGAIVIAPGKIDTIATPVSGWLTITNAANGVPGTDQESDLAYKARADRSVALRGSSQYDALYAALLTLNGVTMVKIYANMTGSTDANGIDAKCIEVFVLGGIDDEITQTIFDKGGFVGYYSGSGTVTGTAFDMLGNPYTVVWSRPTAVPMDVSIDLKEMTGWSVSRVLDTKTACLNFYNGTLSQEGVEPGYVVDQDVFAADLYAPVGVINNLRINTIQVKKHSTGSLAASVAMAYNEYATLIDANITVTHAP